MLNNNICGNFLFSIFFHFAALQILFFTQLVLKTGSYKYQNEKYLKYKIATNVIFQNVWGPQKNLTPFRPVFKPFFDISH